MRTFSLAAIALAVFLPASGWAQVPIHHPVRRVVHHPAKHIVRAAARKPAVPSTITSLYVEAGSGRVITLSASVANVFVANPKIAEVRPASPTSLFVFGVVAGHTTVAALDAAGHTIRQYEVTVRPSRFGANQAQATIASTQPGSKVHLDAQPKALVLNGKVKTPADAAAAAATATAFADPGQAVTDNLHVQGQIQVGLRVRIAEMSRSVTRALGINWQALGTVGKFATSFSTANAISAAAGVSNVLSAAYNGGGSSINGLIDALAQDNLVHVLAEPNLVAMSGESASFLVGGEFPIPVAQQNNTVTVDFKQYGVALDFVPTVLAENRIRLRVRPEVSQLSTQGAVQISAGNSSISIPALTVRRADTTVELGSGQSFAIAGLLSDQTTQNTNALPGLGELPVLGALFRSDSFLRNETELVIIVTPYIVRPVSNPKTLHLPTDGFTPPTDLERLLLLRQEGRVTPGTAQRVPGQAGFAVQ
ncbi:MAG: type II and III secretion system protein family protein [Rhodospirillales bacterium]|nr:type II and III secretion system protein family protein [Rhodospirillales bacterium]MDE2197819.1 type II and III secretion system protein family protein [Rhodospirillales bacterium]MDE2575900.1 type II and III secretion system protein family protein [Rhodospirillales bacterium]